LVLPGDRELPGDLWPDTLASRARPRQKIGTLDEQEEYRRNYFGRFSGSEGDEIQWTLTGGPKAILSNGIGDDNVGVPADG